MLKLKYLLLHAIQFFQLLNKDNMMQHNSIMLTIRNIYEIFSADSKNKWNHVECDCRVSTNFIKYKHLFIAVYGN